MPVKILLADKSITIQKVVEMLFSGKEYEVTCVSDGETAMTEALRSTPDVVLADVDLPRIDGYTLAAQMHQQGGLAQTPVILMLSRDDQYDEARGGQAGIVDNIAKPFESKDLIGKVKKAQSSAPAQPVGRPAPAPASPPAAEPSLASRPAAPASPMPAATPPQKPKQAVPSDIFDIINEAPAQAAISPQPLSAPAAEVEESVFEVEPEFEVEQEREPEVREAVPVEEPVVPSVPQSLPDVEPVAREWVPPAEEPAPAEAEAFVAEQLFGAGPEQAEVPSEGSIAAATFDTFDMGAPDEEVPTAAENIFPQGARAMEEMREGLGLSETEPSPVAMPSSEIESFETLDMATRVSEEYSPAIKEQAAPAADFSAAGGVSDRAAQDAIARVAREVLERVAWEVIPDLAERLIREEIERLKTEK